MSGWAQIWAARQVAEELPTMEALIRADGFDLGAGRVDAAAWSRYCAELGGRLGIRPGDTLFEVGCGAGALLKVFHAAGHAVAGVDYSPALVAAAARAMPGMAFAVAHADEYRAAAHDFVLANSVFSYFPDLDYARRVLERMVATARKGVAILDVPDLARRDAAEAFRAAALPPGEYEARYQALAHLYYAREWFGACACSRGWRLSVCDQWLEGYGNAPYRFNVLLLRHAA